MAEILARLVPWSGKRHLPVSTAEIAKLERAHGELPARYKEFLSSYGAAAFDGLAVVTDGNGERHTIQGLFGAGDWTLSVLALNGKYRDEAMPAGLIAIGNDHHGTLFLLRVSDGVVLHWDNEIDPDEVPDAIRVVAPSFEAFLNAITVETE